MNNRGKLCSLLVLMVSSMCFGGNPLVPDWGMADPHIYIFDGKAYLYSTRDADPQSVGWNMPDWHVWTSDDLIDWKHVYTLTPSETYIGKPIKQCFATDVATKNGKYYFYFSNSTHDTGVAVGDHPAGPFKDALGKPLLTPEMTPGHEYDNTAFVDDDGTPYLIFGACQWNHEKQKGKRYYIVKLNDDMISLAEAPKAIPLTGDFGWNDKPYMHKFNGKYYLSAGANYSIGDSIYGPYEPRRNNSDDKEPYALNRRAHGNYFEWNNQWFFVWCRFLDLKQGLELKHNFRESQLTYVHYKDNGDIDYDYAFLDAHYETGVGQYSATWDTIEAEWYMAADGYNKKELSGGGFEIQNLSEGCWLKYPNMADLKENSSITFKCSSLKGGAIEVRKDSPTGALLGTCNIGSTEDFATYKAFTCTLSNAAGKQDLVLVFKGDTVHLDSFQLGQ